MDVSSQILLRIISSNAFALTNNRKKKLYNNFREYLVSLDDERAFVIINIGKKKLLYKFFWRFEYFTCQFFECIELQFHYPFTTNIFALTNYRGRKYCDINFSAISQASIQLLFTRMFRVLLRIICFD